LDLILAQLSIKDLVDMTVVAFLIYQALLIVHGTRAVQMIVGLGILIVLFWLGISFKLYSLNWILSHFFDSFFIIAIILFQDQFRAALASFGTRRNPFQLFNRESTTIEIEEIVEACGAMSGEKIGAIIVVERDNGLLNYSRTGSNLNSMIHSDIIYAIFQSRSPLHDGAIIISGDRIVAAGCFLPLSKSVEIERHMGTRHRAAIGLTEDCDALVIVLSEETGIINICIAGVLYSCETPHVLRQYLKHILADDSLDPSLVQIKVKESFI
jgi:diadenylate cyclase